MKNGPQIVKATSTNPLIDDLLYETEAKDTKTNVTSLSIKQIVGNIKSYLKWITLQLQNKKEGTPISHNKHSSLKILLDSLKASICIIYLVHMPPTTKNKL